MNFPLYIAKRYLFSKSSTNAINIITWIATFGVIVSSLALFIILSGFSGLRTFSESLLEVSDPDIKISPSIGKKITFSSRAEDILQQDKAVTAFSKIVEERVFLEYKNKNHIAEIKGVDAHYTSVIPIDSTLDVGTWLDRQFLQTAVIGNGISYKLSANIFGEPLKIAVPKAGKGYLNPNNAFNSVNVQIIGTYSGLENFENKYVFTDISIAQALLGYKTDEISAIEVKVEDVDKIDVVKDNLQNKLGNDYKVQTRRQLNTVLYKVLNSENFISYLVGTLIIIVALFNIFGSMIMIIIDKRKNLKTLFNLGVRLENIRKIFVLQGFLLTLFGMGIGLTIGIVLVFIQLKSPFFYIIPTVPYPVELQLKNILIVLITMVVLGFLVSKIAGSKITNDFIEN